MPAWLEVLRERVAHESDPTRRVETLIVGLADAVKAASNDQNVQRLSRELRAASSELAASVVPAQA